MPYVSAARYGKDNVRVYKREKNGDVETVTEMTVCCLLEGKIETSYTEADNSVVVATDSMKNTIYIKAKEYPVNPLEQFAALLGQHFLDKYPHINVANIDIVQHKWTRMVIDGKPHPHSFLRDGDDKRTVTARIARDGIEIHSSLKDLLVLKSTGSMFYGYVQDEFTTLKETWDRILSTSVDATWSWKKFATIDEVKAKADIFNKAFDAARDITLKTFAEEESPSVQNTMYKMCEKILDVAPETEKVAYALPNKHYFEIGT
jgi:urate oxidase